MSYEEWPYSRVPHRRGTAWLVSLLMGLLGVVIGAVLVYGLFVYYFIPQPPPEPGNGQAADPGSPLLPYPEGMEAADVVNRVMPAVVGVDIYVYVTHRGEKTLAHSGSGSGVVISADGYIVTNQHVIENADEITVVLFNAESCKATLVGEDPLTDLALLKIERNELTHIPLGDSARVRVGETVLAIGNPLDLRQTVTAGVISAVERQIRHLGEQLAYTYLQTDAGINRGNSGGPLVNLYGEVIGINTLKVVHEEVDSIGFAIPSNIVKRVVGDLKDFGHVRRPFLGVLVEDYAQYTGVNTDRGVHIRHVESGSPAETSGLQDGDIVVAVGDKHVFYLAQLFDALLEFYPGEQIEITAVRDGRERTFTVTLAERQDNA